MSASLLAREFGGRSDLERGGGSLASGSVDEVGEYLSLLQEKVESLHSILYLPSRHTQSTQGGL